MACLSWGHKPDLYLACYTQEQIALEVGLDRSQVSKLLCKLADSPEFTCIEPTDLVTNQGGTRAMITETDAKAIRKSLDDLVQQQRELCLEIRALRTVLVDLVNLGRDKPVDLKKLTEQQEAEDLFQERVVPVLTRRR